MTKVTGWGVARDIRWGNLPRPGRFAQEKVSWDLGLRLVRRQVDREVARLRGGSWYDDRMDARAVYRFNYHPAYRDDDIGFRVVRKGGE